MTTIENLRGVNSIVHTLKTKSILMGVIAFAAFVVGACSGGPGPAANGGDPNEVAARVNGKDIKMEEVEKAMKAQAQGAEVNFSPLELASARISAIQQLIQTEVLF